MNQTNYNIIIATDSFKGSMTSYEAGDAIATAIKEQTPSRVTVYPVADGGEGTTEALSFGRAAVLPPEIMARLPEVLVHRATAVRSLPLALPTRYSIVLTPTIPAAVQPIAV